MSHATCNQCGFLAGFNAAYCSDCTKAYGAMRDAADKWEDLQTQLANLSKGVGTFASPRITAPLPPQYSLPLDNQLKTLLPAAPFINVPKGQVWEVKVKTLPPKCDCGALKANTTHADYCSTRGNP